MPSSRGGRFALELQHRDWLLQAGFATVDGYGQDGVPLSPASRRLLVVAQC